MRHTDLPQDINRVTGEVVDTAMKVHTHLGPGLLESAYQTCLAYELRKCGLKTLVQHPIPIMYESVQMEVGYRADMLVEDTVIVELKAVEKLIPTHEVQLHTHLKLGGFKVGLLINFHERHLRDGIRRRVSNF